MKKHINIINRLSHISRKTWDILHKSLIMSDWLFLPCVLPLCIVKTELHIHHCALEVKNDLQLWVALASRSHLLGERR